MREKKTTNIPLVSIIMNCHNGEDYLFYSLKSIINQTYKNWELIFFDNCSRDQSKKIFKKFNDKRFKYYNSKKKLKLYHARYLAVKKCRGKFICFLDTDDLWKKNKLSYQINFLEKKKCEVLYTKFDINNLISKKKYLNSKIDLAKGMITQSLLDNYRIGILTVILKKKIFKKINFKKNYTIIGDFDFFIRLSKKYRICSSNISLAIYRNHYQNLSNKKINVYLNELENWLKCNKILLKNYNLSNVYFTLFKLKIKNFLYLIRKLF